MRKQSGLSTFCISQQEYDKISRFIQQNNVKLTGQSVSYDHSSDVVGFLSFKTDLFHKQGLELLEGQKLPK